MRCGEHTLLRTDNLETVRKAITAQTAPTAPTAPTVPTAGQTRCNYANLGTFDCTVSPTPRYQALRSTAPLPLPDVKPEKRPVPTPIPPQNPAPAVQPFALPREVARRLVILWPFKAFGTTAFMALFFWGYFAVLRYPLGVPLVMPELALDRWIPFTAASYPIYVSLWVYVSLPPALLGNLRALLHYGLWMALMCSSSLLFFWLVPTQTPPFDIDWSLYPSMSTIKSIDAAGNAFPSLHVASAVFSALWLDRLFAHLKAPTALRWSSALLCTAIAWSTIASRQHVMLDVFAGAAMGLAFALGSLRAIRSHHLPVTL